MNVDLVRLVEHCECLLMLVVSVDSLLNLGLNLEVLGQARKRCPIFPRKP